MIFSEDERSRLERKEMNNVFRKCLSENLGIQGSRDTTKPKRTISLEWLVEENNKKRRNTTMFRWSIFLSVVVTVLFLALI